MKRSLAQARPSSLFFTNNGTDAVRRNILQNENPLGHHLPSLRSGRIRREKHFFRWLSIRKHREQTISSALKAWKNFSDLTNMIFEIEERYEKAMIDQISGYSLLYQPLKEHLEQITFALS